MISRKDFQAIAAAFQKTHPPCLEPEPNLSKTLQWQSDAIAVANALSDLNPAFNRDRFLRACLPEEFRT